MATGKIKQIIGPVVDVEFPAGQLPDIYNAITIKSSPEDNAGKAIDITMEAMQHLGNNVIRCVALSSTDGLRRGITANDTGSPITVPVGKATLGRMMNVLGQSIDGAAPSTQKKSCRSTDRLRILRTWNLQPRYWKPALR